jgi:fibronectin type 3 domain-containing protein
MTTENVVIRTPLRLDLRIGLRPDPFRESDWLATAMPVPEAPVESGIAHYAIPTTPWMGKTVVVGVRVIGANDKASAWSTFITIPVVAPPPIPMNVSAVAVPEGVRLSWQAAGSNFRIFRRTNNEDFTPIGDTTQSPYTDTSAEFGKPYDYRVVTIAKIDAEHAAESDPSGQFSITPKDTFPPAVPSGLRATAIPMGIELSWEGNTEGDLAGYRIYRAEAGGPFERIAEAALPAYADRMAEHGKTYRYAISSFDRSGNESDRTAAVEAVYP